MARLNWLAVTAATAGAFVAAATSAQAVSFTPIDSDGPLSHISISNDLTCQVRHVADSQAEFYPSVDFDQGACGTEIAVGGATYGPSDVTGGNNPDDFSPVSQSSVTGDGTATTPYTLTTVVTAGPIRITETDSYVEGHDDYRTDLALKNTTTTSQSLTLYRFGDCYLHEDDIGFGQTVGTGIACATTNTPATAGTLAWLAMTAGSHFYEGAFGPLYSTMDAGTQFPDTCDCGTARENAAGLSWTATLAKNASKTFSHTTRFRPTGPEVLTVTTGVSKPEVLNNAVVTYTLKYKNTTSHPVDLTEMTDALPSTFHYVAGSSSGLTTADPTIDAPTNRVTWDGTRTIAAGATATQKLKVTATGPAGPLYYDRAGGTATVQVQQSGPAAPLRICTFVDTAGGHPITGTTLDDVICAGDGDDTIDGLDGNDILVGDAGNDTITGGNGNDTLEGDAGGDTLGAGPGADTFIGGAGIDTVIYGNSILSPLTIDLNDNGPADGASGEGEDIRADVENATGGGFDDVMIGNSLANTLNGGGGADSIQGKGGIDLLQGGAGFDTLTGNDDGSITDTLNCQADGGHAVPGPDDVVTGCT